MTRLNYTGRRRITRDRVGLRVRVDGGPPVLDVLALRLDGLDLPDDAFVAIEAYRQTAYMRFDAGTVSEAKPPYGEPLTQFETPESIRFRVKVVGASADRGKILAAAARLRAVVEEDDAPRPSLLDVKPQKLGQLLWKLEIDSDRPILIVNSEVGDWKGLAMQSTFQALVIPEVFRRIVEWVVSEVHEGSSDEDDGSDLAMWAGLLKELGHDPETLDSDDPSGAALWVDEAVETFARRFKFRDLVSGLVGEPEE